MTPVTACEFSFIFYAFVSSDKIQTSRTLRLPTCCQSICNVRNKRTRHWSVTCAIMSFRSTDMNTSIFIYAQVAKRWHRQMSFSRTCTTLATWRQPTTWRTWRKRRTSTGTASPDCESTSGYWTCTWYPSMRTSIMTAGTTNTWWTIQTTWKTG